jgi:hypothetical protein
MSTSKLIDGHTPEHLLKCAEDIIKKKRSVVMTRLASEVQDAGTIQLINSSFRYPCLFPLFYAPQITQSNRFPINFIEQPELQIGRVLGRGGFCVVKEISKITLKEADSENFSSNSSGQEKIRDEHQIHNFVQDRSFMETHCVRQGKDCRYAIKRLQASSADDTQTFINGVVDLALEARFLSVIRNPNIIKMRGMAMGSPFDLKFFVVLDRLYDIMSTRLVKWKKQIPKGMAKLLDRSGKKELAFWVERCTVCYDLACALKYLHHLQ